MSRPSTTTLAPGSLRLMLERVLDRLRAAHAAAVGVLFVAALDALDHHDGRVALALQLGRQLARGQRRLELALRDHVRVLAVQVELGAALLAARRDDDHAVGHLPLLSVHIEHALEVADVSGDACQGRVQVDVDEGMGLDLVHQFGADTPGRRRPRACCGPGAAGRRGPASFSTRWTWKPWSAMPSAAVMPARPPPSTSADAVTGT